MSPMYKNGVEMAVSDDPIARAELAKHGWTEDKPKKKAPKKKVAKDDGSE